MDDYSSNSRQRGREIEVLRRQYREHRDALVRLAAGAPTQHLEAEYQRLIRDIDTAVAKLDEIDRAAAAGTGATTVRAAIPVNPHGDPLRQETGAGSRPLVSTPASEFEPTWEPTFAQEGAPPERKAPTAIIIAGLVVLAVIGWLVWRASRDRHPAATSEITSTEAAPVAHETAAPGTVVQPVPVTPAPKPAAASLRVEPATADYGVVRKGTRSVRQIEITNLSGHPIAYQVARSQCRCLYYEYKGQLAANAHETLTVTVDGAKAKAGALQESVAITSKTDPSLNASFDVSATVK